MEVLSNSLPVGFGWCENSEMEVLLNSLPVGFGFRPTDAELVNHYLRAKNNGDNKAVSIIREVDLCKYEPSDLPDMSLIKATADEWFFLCPKDRKYHNSQRLKRATVKGYWKTAGIDQTVESVEGTAVIGMKKTLVFYSGRAPTGKKTNWVIHEYRATSKEPDGTNTEQGSYVLFKLMKKPDGKLDQAEGKVDSPLTVESNTEDTKLEPVTRIPSAQGEKLPSSIDKDLGGHSDRRPQDPQLDWPSSSCVSDDLADETGDEKIMPPDPELEEMLKQFISDPHGVDEIFSVINAQMQTDIEASLGVRYADPNNDTGHGHDGQYGPNEEYINNFLNKSILSEEQLNGNRGNYSNGATENKDPLCNGTGSCNESEAGFAHPERPCDFGGYGPIQQNIGREPPVYLTIQQNISWGTGQSVLQSEFLGQYFVTAPSASAQLYENTPQESTNNNSTSVESETGIKIRTRPCSNRPTAQISEPQGSAPRRVRLLVNLQGGSLRCPNFEEFSSNEENGGAKQTVAKAGKAREELGAAPATSSIVTLEITLSKSTTDAEEVAGGSSMNVKSRSCYPPGRDKGVPTAARARKISLSAYLLRVLVTLGLAVALVGICYTFEIWHPCCSRRVGSGWTRPTRFIYVHL